MRQTDNKIFAQRIGRILILAMTEILGEDDTRTILDRTGLLDQTWLQDGMGSTSTFPGDMAMQIQTELERTFGSRAGRGLTLRVGRACLKYSLREFGIELGFTETNFRLMPLQKKVRAGCEILAAFINQQTSFHVDVATSAETISWQISNCPLCHGRSSDHPCCSMAIGFFQEGMYWVSGGKTYAVREGNCIASGANVCTIDINKTPIS